MMNYVKLGNICEIARGGSPRPINDYLTNDNNGINWIKIGDTSSDSKYIEHTEQKIKPEGVKKSRYVKVGDFILSNSMSFGRPYILKIDGCIHDGWLVLQNIDSKLDKDYLYTVLSSPYAYHQFEKMAVGGVVNNLNSDKVKELIIPLPSLEKQKRIAKVLEECNSIIIKHKKLLEKYDTLIKSRFIEMFENSPTRIVDEVCESFKIGPFGSALHKNEMSTQGYAFVLGTDNAVKNEFAYKEIRYINQEKYNELSKYKVEPKEIIMSMMGTVGRVALIPENIGTAIISSHLCILRINPKIMHPEFFHLAFSKDDEIQFQIDGIHNGSIMKGFNLKIVKAFKIKCPDIQEQNNFISFAKQIDKSKFEIWLTLKNYGIIGKRVFLYDQF